MPAGGIDFTPCSGLTHVVCMLLLLRVKRRVAWPLHQESLALKDRKSTVAATLQAAAAAREARERERERERDRER